MAVRVGINGFGRTGRALLRAARRRDLGLEVVAVNDLAPPAALARLLARDSVFGRYGEPVSVEDGEMVVGGDRVRMVAEPELGALPWRDLDVDVVVECTGRFTARDRAARHLAAGRARVVVSAPSKGADATFVMGVNDGTFDPERHLVVSNASCTTNCLVPMAKVLDDAFGIERGYMTTVHAYTGDQRLVDAVHKDPRRARAAAVNIVPTTTGAARATGEVLTHLAGRLDGISLRVPVPDGSMTDLVATVRERPGPDEVREAFRRAAAEGPLAGRLEYAEDGLVSSDVVGDPASCIFDAELTMASGPPGEGARVVRQRVGVRQPPGRARRPGGRGGEGLTPWPTRPQPRTPQPETPQPRTPVRQRPSQASPSWRTSRRWPGGGCSSAPTSTSRSSPPPTAARRRWRTTSASGPPSPPSSGSWAAGRTSPPAPTSAGPRGGPTPATTWGPCGSAWPSWRPGWRSSRTCASTRARRPATRRSWTGWWTGSART